MAKDNLIMDNKKNSGLVQVITVDGLCLQGLFISGDSKLALLHIHGFEGNFYENKFVQLLAKIMGVNKITFLSVNTRGCEKIKDFNTSDGGIKTIGARYELLEESPIDIDAWVEFLIEQGYEDIVLSGHSLGTYKVVRYLFEGKHKDRIKKLILLSPFDSKSSLIVSGRSVDKLLIEAQKKVDSGKGEEMITKKFDDIAISYKTYTSWYKQDDFGRMFEFCNKDYEFPILRKIKIPTKIIVGSLDEFFNPSKLKDSNQGMREGMNLLLKNIRNSEGKIIKNAVHSFAPYEEEMVKEVVKYIIK